MEPWLIVVLIVVALALVIVCSIIAFNLGVSHRKRTAESLFGSAEEEAKKIVSDAIKSAEAKKKETLLEAKDEIHRLRSEADKDMRERRSEVQRQERRILQKEESLDHKL